MLHPQPSRPDPGPERLAACHTGSVGEVFALDRPVMAVPEAARQLRIPPSTLKHWLDGHAVGGTWYQPVLRVASAPGTSMTWGEVVEASYLRAYRQVGVSLQKLRPFIMTARELFEVRYPLAHLRPFVGTGRRLLLEAQQIAELDQSLRVVFELASGQMELDHRAWGYIQSIDFTDGETAARIRIAGPDRAVVLDPAMSSGASTVHGVRTEVLAEQAIAGTPIDDIADDFSLSRADVAAALDHEYSLAS